MNEIQVLIVCDCDPDREQFGGNDSPYNTRNLEWRGIEKGIPSLLNICNELRKKDQLDIRIAWMLRADSQIDTIYGDAAWSVKTYKDTWLELQRSGHELGWHPHLLRLIEKEKIWFHEIIDDNWINDCLKKGFNSITTEFKPMCARSGRIFHNNYTMKIFKEMGIKVDISAHPGLYHTSYLDIQKKYLMSHFDWRSAPEIPYFIDTNDYQKAAAIKEDAMLEIPITVSGMPWWTNIIKKGKNIEMRKRAARITKHPAIFKKAIEEAINYTGFLVTYFHPDELLSSQGYFSIRNFKRNLKLIQSISSKHKRTVKFVTPREVHSMMLKREV